MAADQPPPHYVIFCQVIDNLGDIGVCWRLARQLVAEQQIHVTLWLDDLERWQQLEPKVNPELAQQTVAGVEVCHWSKQTLPTLDAWLHTWQPQPPSAVIEAFGCNLPENVIQAMRGCAPKPVWINLEYLSAEAWIEGCHLQASPQQGLTKHFFFPGFTCATGGVLREADADQTFQRLEDGARRAWIATQAQVPESQLAAEALMVSLFAYDNPAIASLIDVWAHQDSPTVLFAPMPALSALLPRLMSALQCKALNVGQPIQQGSLTVVPMPMLPQSRYDQWLAQMDINFVRGEDSFVRAQWALMPWVWHIYPQADYAHEGKLMAFLQRYRADLPAATADAVSDLWQLWNGMKPPAPRRSTAAIWRHFLAERHTLARHAHHWQQQQKNHGDLCSKLVQFVKFSENAARIPPL